MKRQSTLNSLQILWVRQIQDRYLLLHRSKNPPLQPHKILNKIVLNLFKIHLKTSLSLLKDILHLLHPFLNICLPSKLNFLLLKTLTLSYRDRNPRSLNFSTKVLIRMVYKKMVNKFKKHKIKILTRLSKMTRIRIKLRIINRLNLLSKKYNKLIKWKKLQKILLTKSLNLIKVS